MKTIKEFLITEGSNPIDIAIDSMFDYFNDCDDENDEFEGIREFLNGLTGQGKDDIYIKVIEDWLKEIKK